ncbi:MAG: substrate-binding domain-containing protein, partial [Bryobacteraceae bacterium]
DAGLQVPDDITVIGVDNIRFADLLRVPLSGIDQNSYQIGERTARLALKLIESLKPLRSAQIVLPIQLVARDSTQARLVSGSYPKSVMALEALWMLDVVSQRGFRECAQHHVSTSSIPGNVEGAGFFDSLGRIDGSSERSELALETESVQASLKSREIGRARGLVGPRNDASRHHGR